MSKGVYFANIEKLTKDNEKYRKVLNTNSHLQLVLMSIPPKENIPKEVHSDVDQFFKIESGKGKAIVDGKQYPLFDGTALIVPANSQHEIINTGNKPLKIYTIYAPPEHPFNRVDEVKPMEGGSNFKTKYQKYKLKYLSLKNQQQGGAMHKVHVSQPWYSYIKGGKKTVEGRLNKGTFAQIKEGDLIEFYNNELNDSFNATVTKISHHDSFYEMIQTNGLNNVLPGIDTVEQGVQVYRQYYPEEVEKEFKVLAIHINVKN